MNKNSIYGKEGAGLGIIDMAMKSENTFEFSFKKIDSEFFFFTLKIKIDY